MAEPRPAACFALLPAELRLEIWRYALPPDLEPTFFQYKEKFWQKYRSTLYKQTFEKSRESIKSIANRGYDQCFNPPAIDLSMAVVNHEARFVTQQWLDRQVFEVRPVPGGSMSRPAFGRNFVPEYDTLFVPLHEWDDFHHGPRLLREVQHRFNLDDNDCLPDMDRYVTRLAVPEELLRLSNGPEVVFKQLRERCTSVDKLLIVINPPVGWSGMDLSRWEFRNFGRGAYFWTVEDRRCNYVHDSNGGSTFVDRTMAMGRDLYVSLYHVQSIPRDLEIRFVKAHRESMPQTDGQDCDGSAYRHRDRWLCQCSVHRDLE